MGGTRGAGAELSQAAPSRRAPVIDRPPGQPTNEDVVLRAPRTSPLTLGEGRPRRLQRTLYVRDSNAFLTRGSAFAVSGGCGPPVVS